VETIASRSEELNPTCENEMMPGAAGNNSSNDLDSSFSIGHPLKCTLSAAVKVRGKSVWNVVEMGPIVQDFSRKS
jgi:hypothetical protein